MEKVDMEKLIKPSKSSLFVVSVLYVLIGILFVILACFPGVIGILLTIMGALAVVAGIFSIVKKNVLIGVIEITLGALVITAGWVEILFLAFVLVIGAVLTIKEIVNLVVAIKHKDSKGIVFAILGILIGGLLITSAFVRGILASIFTIIFIILGVMFMITGAVMMVMSLVAEKKAK